MNMTRQEVEKYTKEKRDEGYITHPMLLELYGWNEEVPDYMVKLIVHKPKEPSSNVILTGAEGKRKLDNVFKDHMEKSTQ